MDDFLERMNKLLANLKELEKTKTGEDKKVTLQSITYIDRVIELHKENKSGNDNPEMKNILKAMKDLVQGTYIRKKGERV